METKIPCSPEQLDVIFDHIFYGSDLGMLPDERNWMVNYLNKKIGNVKITKAELIIEYGQWKIEYE